MALQRKYNIAITGTYPNKILTLTDNASGRVVETIEQRNVDRVEGVFIEATSDPLNANLKTPENQPTFKTANGGPETYTINNITKVQFFSSDYDDIATIELQHIDNDSDINGGDQADVDQFLADWVS